MPTKVKWILSGANTNVWPQGYAKISSKSDCRDAADALNIPVGSWNNGETTNGNEPGGCFQNRDGDAFYNHAQSGNADPQCAPICQQKVAQLVLDSGALSVSIALRAFPSKEAFHSSSPNKK